MSRLLSIAVLIAVGVGGVWALSNARAPGSTTTEQPAQSNIETPTQQATPLAPARIATAGYIEYRNARYRFSLFYPDSLKVKEIDEGGGAMTVTFQNVASVQGFQIFIVPHGESTVSEARFKQDVPSGVRKGSRDIAIDSVTANSFFSTNAILGDTAEIWFINGGYLFEVTTLKPLSGWLSQIMMSWEFI